MMNAGAQRIKRIALIVRGAQGLMLGLGGLYIWGPLFYEQLILVLEPSAALSVTAILFGLECLLIALLEVPTGALGDVFGRKWSVVTSHVFQLCNFLLLAWIPWCVQLWLILTIGALVIVTFALSYTFLSGSLTAWCVDSLRHWAPDVGYEQVLAPAQRTKSLAQLCGAAITILLYSFGWASWAFLFGAAIALISLIFCLGEMENEKGMLFLSSRQCSITDVTTRMGEVVGLGLQIFRRSPAILSLVVTYGAYLTVNNLITLLWPIHVRASFPGVSQIGLWLGLACVMQFAESVGAHGLTIWARKLSPQSSTPLRQAFIGAAIGSTLPILLLSTMAWLQLPTLSVFIVTVVGVGLAYGVICPSFETLVNHQIPASRADERATIMSFGSMVNSLFVLILATPASGVSGAQTILGWAFPAGLLLIAALLGNRVLRYHEKKAPLTCVDYDNDNGLTRRVGA